MFLFFPTEAVWLVQANLMAVFSVASGSSAAGGSSARISSGLRGSFRGGLCSLPLIPIPAVMAFHKALWDFEPDIKKKKKYMQKFAVSSVHT